jgi:hypothetical protein
MRNGSVTAAVGSAAIATALYSDGIVVESSGSRAAAVELKNLVSKGNRQAAGWLQRRPTAGSEFSFRDHWEVDGRMEDVAQMLLDTDAISCWWPQLAGVTVGATGCSDGMGRKFAARASGFLPYELAIDFRVVRVRFPERFSVELAGDLCGYGGGRLKQVGSRVAIDFELTVCVARPVLHFLLWVARPALYAQHRWVMRQGEMGLRKTMESRQRIGADK